MDRWKSSIRNHLPLIDLEKFDKFFGVHGTIRKHVLQKMENLRQSKVIGKSSEAGVELIWCGPYRSDQSKAFWDGNAVREALNVSWVEMNWGVSPSFDCVITVWDLKGDPEFVNCPRCYMYHKSNNNYDNLCFRCGQLMMSNYANHPTMDDYFNDRPKLSHTRFKDL
jgi:hypothetical protein